MAKKLSMGAAADSLYNIRQKRLAAQRVVDELQAEETSVREYIIANLPKSDTGAAGKIARVSVVLKEIPHVTDWEKLRAYIARTKSFELFQRRLSDQAVKERWDSGVAIPGIEKSNIVTISLVKV